MVSKSHLALLFGSTATEAEFEAQYRAKLPRILDFFRYRVCDEALAEDLTSETFEKAWRHRNRYRRHLAAFSTWLFTTARRVVADHYRKHRAEISLDDPTGIAAAETTEQSAVQPAEFARLAILLARLADRERDLIALKYGGGLTNRSIAGLARLSDSNVGVTLHRTVQVLRAEWENNRER